MPALAKNSGKFMPTDDDHLRLQADFDALQGRLEDSDRNDPILEQQLLFEARVLTLRMLDLLTRRNLLKPPGKDHL
jgi:hypothetical protein